MKLVFAGGGTGGHLIPGISLAEEILKKNSASQLLFISTGKPLEKQLFERFSLPFCTISARPMTKQPRKIPGFLFHTANAIRQSISILREFRPEGVIGLGGYGAAPVLLAAKLLNIPFFILEQNAIPGSVNLLFAPFSKKVCCQFEQSLPYFKELGLLTGNPIRSALRQEVRDARQQLGLEPDRFTLLVMGGSQGAQAINRCMAETVQLLSRESPSLKIQIVHLTGAKEMEALEHAYTRAQVPHKLFSFLEAMELAYSSCDLVIGRAGGTSLAEITALGLPSILIPFPQAKADHQYLNAIEIEKKGAAIVYREAHLTPEKLLAHLREFCENPQQLLQMRECSKKIGRLDAGASILSVLESTLKVA